MNVLLMTDKLETGGAEFYFCKLANTLNHPECSFFTAASLGDMVSKLEHPTHFTTMSRRNHGVNIYNLRKLVSTQQIDVIHANSLRMVFYAVLIKRTIRTRLAILYTKHNVTSLEQKAPYVFKKIVNKHVEKVITVSQFEERNVINLGVYPDKVKTIYNGVDTQQFQFHDRGDGVYKIGILARLSEEKNHQFFLQIANEFKTNRELQFYIAGDGPEYERISAMISDMQLEDKVKMVGQVDQPEAFIRDMDVLLLTSNREVFPMVILEAMAVGTPIVSIDRGGIKEAIVDSETGFLVPEHRVLDFTNRLEILQSNYRLRKHIIERARRKVEREFSLEQMVQQTLQEYLRAFRGVVHGT